MIGLSTSTWRYERHPDPINTHLLARLTVHAKDRPRFGYRRLHTLVDREGGAVYKSTDLILRIAGSPMFFERVRVCDNSAPKQPTEAND